MKTLITTLVIFVSLVIAAAGTGISQTFRQNSLGMDSETVWGEWCVLGPAMAVYTVSLVLHDPINPDFDDTGVQQPVANVAGFECRIWGEGDVDILQVRYPVNAINAGTESDEFIVGFAEPVPVIDGRAVLAHVDLFLWPDGTNPQPQRAGGKASPLPCDNNHAWVWMAPLRTTPSVADKMAYLDADDPQDSLVGAEGFFIWEEEGSGITLVLEAMTVPTEGQSWGTLKALYR